MTGIASAATSVVVHRRVPEVVSACPLLGPKIWPGGGGYKRPGPMRDQAADRWGFTRYWVAEHHNMTGIASAATSVVVGYIPPVGGLRQVEGVAQRITRRGTLRYRREIEDGEWAAPLADR
jgi:hypothetical protein